MSVTMRRRLPEHFPGRPGKTLSRRSARSAMAVLGTASVLLGSTALPGQVASASAQANTVTITIGYSAGTGDTYYTNEFAAAEKAMPSIKIKPVVYPTYDEQLAEMPAEAAAGTLPDIIVWDNSAPVGQYAAEKAIQPLSAYVSPNRVNLNLFPKALVQAWTYGGKLYGIPLYLQDSAMVYNLSMLHKAGIKTLPTTTAQLESDAVTVHDKTGKAGLTILPNLFHLTQYVLAFGGGWHFGKTIDSAQNVAGLQFLVKVFTKEKAGVLPAAVGATWDGQVVAENDAAMSDGGPWYISFMKATAPKVDYVLRPIPTSSGGHFVVTYGGAYSVTSSDKDPALAMHLLALLGGMAADRAMVTSALGFVPAMTQFLSSYRALYPKYDGITNADLAHGKTLQYPPKTIQFGNALTNGFEQIVDTGSGSVSALLAKLQKQYGS